VSCAAASIVGSFPLLAGEIELREIYDCTGVWRTAAPPD
jgi:hypothetical protein